MVATVNLMHTGLRSKISKTNIRRKEYEHVNHSSYKG